MFERFTGNARNIVVQAQENARRLGHNYIGCEHLLLAVAAGDEPASAVLRDHGVTPERIEANILRTIGRGHGPDQGDPLGNLDREALAAIGIDLDVVRARIEDAFGPDAFARAVHARKRSAQAARRPAWRKGPVAELVRRRRARRHPQQVRAAHYATPRPPDARHVPFTPHAKKSLQLSLREAKALQDNYIGVQHLVLALLAIKDGMPRVILSSIGASSESLRADILASYRKAS